MNKFMVGGISGVMLVTALFGTVYSVQAAEENGTSPSIALETQLETQQAAESSVQPTQDARNFTDVKDGHWAKADIVTAVSKGYVAGYPGGLFKPDQPIKRGEFVKMVVTALGLPVETTTGAWYESYVKVAGDNTFYATSDFAINDKEWNTNITRQEMARIAVRATGATTTEDNKWMYLATKAGLITGLGKGELGKDKTTTRAQSVTIIERILTVKDGGTLPVDKYAVGSAEIAWHGTNIFTVMPEVFTASENELKGRSVEELWQVDKMTIDSKDGKYRGRLDALIAIDMEDQNDPNWKRITNPKELKWFNNDYETKGLKVSDHPNSYLLMFEGVEVYNNAPELYVKRDHLRIGVSGFDSPDIQKFYKGELNTIADVYRNNPGDLPYYILPKTGWVWATSGISFSIVTPGGSMSTFKSQPIIEIHKKSE